MSLLGDLIDARKGAPAEPVAEAFDTALHPHVLHGPHGGQFAKKGTKTISAVVATAPRRRSLPQGSGPERPGGVVTTRRTARTARSSVNKTRTNVHGAPRAPGAGAERAPAARPRKLKEHELPGAVGKGRWSKGAAAVVDGLHKGTVKDTESAHRLPGQGGKMGPYKPERIELHARIARALLQGAGQHQQPEAHFMAGGPASGKSRLLKDGHVRTPADAVDVNPDIVKEMLPEYHALKARGDKAASSKVHEESSHISKLLMNIALAQGHHVVVDGTGNGAPGSFARKIKAARDHGHRVSVNYATIPTAEAERRAEARAKKTGRAVPAGYLRSAHRSVSERFVKDVAGLDGVVVRVYDTGTKRRAKLIFDKSDRGAGRVKDRKRYAAFLAKAGEGD